MSESMLYSLTHPVYTLDYLEYFCSVLIINSCSAQMITLHPRQRSASPGYSIDAFLCTYVGQNEIECQFEMLLIFIVLILILIYIIL